MRPGATKPPASAAASAAAAATNTPASTPAPRPALRFSEELGRVEQLTSAFVALGATGLSAAVFAVREDWSAALALCLLIGVFGATLVHHAAEGALDGAARDAMLALGSADPISAERARRAARERERERPHFKLASAAVAHILVWTVWLFVGSIWPSDLYVDGALGLVCSLVGTAVCATCVFLSHVRKSFGAATPLHGACVVFCAVFFVMPVDVSASNSPPELFVHWLCFSVVLFAAALHAMSFKDPGMRVDLVLCQSLCVLSAPWLMAVLVSGAFLLYWGGYRRSAWLAAAARKNAAAAASAAASETHDVEAQPPAAAPAPSPSPKQVHFSGVPKKRATPARPRPRPRAMAVSVAPPAMAMAVADTQEDNEDENENEDGISVKPEP
jgi:hypothetical protein